MLTINNSTFTEKPSTFTITSKDEVFKETIYHDLGFEINIKPLTRADSINIMANVSNVDAGKVRMNAGSMTREIFIASIVSWSGIVDEDGKEIPCTTATKSAVWDSPTLISFSDAIQMAIRTHTDEVKEVKATVKKKSSPTSSGKK